jgi:hypothetical protein
VIILVYLGRPKAVTDILTRGKQERKNHLKKKGHATDDRR